jgi:hypothetical protein
VFDSWTATNAATGASKVVKTNLYEDVADADYTVKALFKPLKVMDLLMIDLILWMCGRVVVCLYMHVCMYVFVGVCVGVVGRTILLT